MLLDARKIQFDLKRRADFDADAGTEARNESYETRTRSGLD